MLELCGLKGHRIGGAADLAEARELHRERRRRDDGRLPRADGRGAPPRARAVRRRARARGRAARRDRRRADVAVTAVGAGRRTANTAAWPAGDESSVDRVPVRARRASSSRFRGGSPASASICRGSSPPAARSAIAFLIVARRRSSPGSVPARRACSPFARSTSAGRHRRVASQVRKALAPTRGTSLLKVDLDAVAAGGGGAPDRRRAHASTARFPTRFASSSCPSGRSRSCARAPTRTSSPRAAG